ncbi:heme oxygenase-like protein [Pluteus cervinus]|uniref:Heme oxygenase-like protein n=1 Tax=Pluteus cervinus TaxID=181527 RepID=A0ACD3AYW4_9AGAR|nr:heme oxygenase-like protein [Pluteus cervinus]
MSTSTASPPTSPTSSVSTSARTTPDWSQPLAKLLREATHEAHDTVAQSPAAKALLSGLLSKEEYVRYLMMLYHVYDTFERGLDRHSTHPVLEPTYNPTLLARTSALSSDISYLLQAPSSSWKSHPVHKALTSSPPPALVSYIGRLTELSNSQDPTGLLSHAYVRYLGDLSGGQTIRHTIAKAYGLDEQEGLGLEFYRFNEMAGQKMAGQGEMKRIKEWFRESMNVVGERDRRVKEIVLAESNRAFELNADLFDCIESQEPIDDDDAAPDTESTYPVSSVIAVVAAACLAHFLLVTCGFTGTLGYQKLIAFEEWFDQFWKGLVETKSA